MGFPVASFDSACRYSPDANDRLLVTYPKSGTTWVQNIIYLLLHEGRELRPDQRLDQYFPHLEEVGAEVVRRLSPPRLIKTHLSPRRLSFARAARYICVARNPFDCVVSFYHHTRGFPHHYDFEQGTFDEFFECFLAGEVDFGDYFEHLAECMAASCADNVLFLTYEALQRDTAACVRAIANHLGGDAARAAADPRILAAVLRYSGIQAMRRDQQRWSSARPADQTPFVRRGRVGDWQRVLSAEQARRLAARFRCRTRATDAGCLWRDILKKAEES